MVPIYCSRRSHEFSGATGEKKSLPHAPVHLGDNTPSCSLENWDIGVSNTCTLLSTAAALPSPRLWSILQATPFYVVLSSWRYVRPFPRRSSSEEAWKLSGNEKRSKRVKIGTLRYMRVSWHCDVSIKNVLQNLLNEQLQIMPAATLAQKRLTILNNDTSWEKLQDVIYTAAWYHRRTRKTCPTK
jgi:hypothetical protein